jgi:hypothetical protein
MPGHVKLIAHHFKCVIISPKHAMGHQTQKYAFSNHPFEMAGLYTASIILARILRLGICFRSSRCAAIRADPFPWYCELNHQKVIEPISKAKEVTRKTQSFEPLPVISLIFMPKRDVA